jgi:hypothetical protein
LDWYGAWCISALRRWKLNFYRGPGGLTGMCDPWAMQHEPHNFRSTPTTQNLKKVYPLILFFYIVFDIYEFSLKIFSLPKM